MKFYNYEKIDEMIQPLIEMMQKEYPNDAQLIIDSSSATIQYVHKDIIFLESSLKPDINSENPVADALSKACGLASMLAGPGGSCGGDGK